MDVAGIRDLTLPNSLSINAWTGSVVLSSKISKKLAKQWAAEGKLAASDQFVFEGASGFAQPHPNLRQWDSPEVGWGLVLADNENISYADRALGVDAPAPIRELLARRNNAPIFRYRRDLKNLHLRRYFADGTRQDVRITSAGERGVDINRLPYYLLIYGSPQVIPWSLQYALNQPCFVGRLDLEGEGLERYVRALLDNWSTAACQYTHPVVWAVDQGTNDITTLMSKSIAEPVADLLKRDNEIGEQMTLLNAQNATVNALINTLASSRPALIVSTSHGMTGPLDNPERMAAQLGMLVDRNGTLLQLDNLLAAWQPDGAIWYAHACCSAGSDNKNSYQGLVTQNSLVEKVLNGLAALGAHVAPLPKMLLGAEKPLRAFIGHVEPTFDWTIRDPHTRQRLTKTIQSALYNNLYQQERESVGMAFRGTYRHVGELFAQWHFAIEESNRSNATPAERKSAQQMAIHTQLTALDRQSLVILGDPTVALPAWVSG